MPASWVGFLDTTEFLEVVFQTDLFCVEGHLILLRLEEYVSVFAQQRISRNVNACSLNEKQVYVANVGPFICLMLF